MNAPISYRKNIPFFYDKSDAEFQKDIYERFGMVQRQIALHFTQVGRQHFMDKLIQFSTGHCQSKAAQIVEIGSGLGNWIGSIAMQRPESNCWGLD
ncbi:MAG: hypothetical protein AAGK97_17025, partial [Bacteroidota bacterium]